jgi:catechol 2,3-dioxygenase-like lactoylglutathione lyase family enzyme
MSEQGFTRMSHVQDHPITSDTDTRFAVVFEINGETYTASLREFEIVHDGIHHAIPEDIRRGKRLVLRGPAGEDVYPDMFAGEVVRGYGDGASVRLATTLTPIEGTPGPWRNVGIDHVVINVADREGACRFFADALQMQVMRHDPHMTVMTTGHTSLFLFDTGPGIPMSDGLPSRWHHIGFVVDNLDHAYHHLRQFADLSTDFTLLERQERWSLYGYYTNGDVTFMIQLSEIRDGWKGFDNPEEITGLLYDYSGQRYGKRLEG